MDDNAYGAIRYRYYVGRGSAYRPELSIGYDKQIHRPDSNVECPCAAIITAAAAATARKLLSTINTATWYRVNVHKHVSIRHGTPASPASWPNQLQQPPALRQWLLALGVEIPRTFSNTLVLPGVRNQGAKQLWGYF